MTDGVYKSQGLWQVILTRNDTGSDPIVVGTFAHCAQLGPSTGDDVLQVHAQAKQMPLGCTKLH